MPRRIILFPQCALSFHGQLRLCSKIFQILIHVQRITHANYFLESVLLALVAGSVLHIILEINSQCCRAVVVNNLHRVPLILMSLVGDCGRSITDYECVPNESSSLALCIHPCNNNTATEQTLPTYLTDGCLWQFDTKIIIGPSDDIWWATKRKRINSAIFFRMKFRSLGHPQMTRKGAFQSFTLIDWLRVSRFQHSNSTSGNKLL